jgi:hypothetical protein
VGLETQKKIVFFKLLFSLEFCVDGWGGEGAVHCTVTHLPYLMTTFTLVSSSYFPNGLSLLPTQ